MEIEAVKAARVLGSSIPEISERFKIARSTAWRITEKVIIAPEKLRVIQSRRGGSTVRRILNTETAYKEATSILKKSYSETVRPLILAALYWAEGTKSSFVFTNTDADMIRVFASILREEFEVSNDRFQVLIRVGTRVNLEKILSHWSSVLNLPVENLRVNINSKYNKTTVEYGLCRITIAKGGQLLKTILALNGKLTEAVLQDKINTKLL